MIKTFNIRNVGGYDHDTGTGNPQNTLPPLFCIDYLNERGHIIVTSGTHSTYRAAENAVNARIEAERNRG